MATNNLPPQAPAPTPTDAGILDIVTGGFGALAGWLNVYGWSVIGLGLLALVATYFATEFSKAVIDWARDERRKRPVAMADDTHKLLIRLASVANGSAIAHAFGFGAKVGPAIGVDFPWFSALVIGGLMNSGGSVAGFHVLHWIRYSKDDGAKRIRATLRIWWGRIFRVSEKEIDTAATSTRNPAITDADIEADLKKRGLDNDADA